VLVKFLPFVLMPTICDVPDRVEIYLGYGSGSLGANIYLGSGSGS
jgi:hypothetical protein